MRLKKNIEMLILTMSVKSFLKPFQANPNVLYLKEKNEKYCNSE